MHCFKAIHLLWVYAFSGNQIHDLGIGHWLGSAVGAVWDCIFIIWLYCICRRRCVRRRAVVCISCLCQVWREENPSIDPSCCSPRPHCSSSCQTHKRLNPWELVQTLTMSMCQCYFSIYVFSIYLYVCMYVYKKWFYFYLFIFHFHFSYFFW